MQHIAWISSYSVQNEELDKQHKQWINYINDFLEESFNNQNIKSKIKLLLNVINYADVHFKSEEEYLRKINYPETEQHILMHKNLKEKIVALESLIETDSEEVKPTALVKFMTHWLINHIRIEDKKYSQYAQQNN